MKTSVSDPPCRRCPLGIVFVLLTIAHLVVATGIDPLSISLENTRVWALRSVQVSPTDLFDGSTPVFPLHALMILPLTTLWSVAGSALSNVTTGTLDVVLRLPAMVGSLLALLILTMNRQMRGSGGIQDRSFLRVPPASFLGVMSLILVSAGLGSAMGWIVAFGLLSARELDHERPHRALLWAILGLGFGLEALTLVPYLLGRCLASESSRSLPRRIAPPLGTGLLILALTAVVSRTTLDPRVGWDALQAGWYQTSVSSADSMNLWFVIHGTCLPGSDASFQISPHHLGLLFLILSAVLALVVGFTRPTTPPCVGLSLLPALTFAFSTRIHPALAILPGILMILHPTSAVWSRAWNLALTLNLAFALRSSTLIGAVVQAGLGILVAATFGILLLDLILKALLGYGLSRVSAVVDIEDGPETRSGYRISVGKEIMAVLILILGFAHLRHDSLGYPDEKIFDEVYHARAAVEIAEGQTPGEWVHPPVAKLLIGVGIRLFGENGYGWRFIPWLAGCLILPLIYLLARSILGDPRFAFLGTLLVALDGCYFVMSRIAMTNVFAVLFQISTVTCLWHYLVQASRPAGRLGYGWWLIATSLSISLGVSTRWTCLWLLAYVGLVYGLHGLFMIGRRFQQGIPASRLTFDLALGVGSGVAHLALIPLGIYTLSYVPLAWSGSYTDLNYIANLQPQIFWFHSTFTTHHPYYSQWYTWPFTYRPVWYFYKTFEEGQVIRGIVALGNPILWWGSIPAVIGGVVLALKKRHAGLAYLVLTYSALFLPWALSPRVLNYSHYYLEPLPYALLLMAALLQHAYGRWLTGMEIGIFIGIVAAMFAFFYPLLAGACLTQNDYSIRIWSNGWL